MKRPHPISAEVAGAWRRKLLQSILEPATVRLLRTAKILPGARVADFGCGEGAVALLLGRMVGPMGRVYAVDRCEASLETLRVKAHAAGISNISLIHGDIDDALVGIPAIDVAYSRFFLMHLSCPRSVLAHIRGKLLEGGRLVVEEPVIVETAEYPRLGLWDSPIALYEALCRWTSTNPNFGREMLMEASAAGFDIDDNFRSQPDLSPELAREYIDCTLRASKAVYIRAGVIDEFSFDRLLSRIENMDVSRIERCSFHTVVQAICSPTVTQKNRQKIPWRQQ